MFLRSRCHFFFVSSASVYTVNSTVFDFISSIVVMTLYIRFFLPVQCFSMYASMSADDGETALDFYLKRILQTRTTRNWLEWCAQLNTHIKHWEKKELMIGVFYALLPNLFDRREKFKTQSNEKTKQNCRMKEFVFIRSHICLFDLWYTQSIFFFQQRKWPTDNGSIWMIWRGHIRMYCLQWNKVQIPFILKIKTDSYRNLQQDKNATNVPYDVTMTWNAYVANDKMYFGLNPNAGIDFLESSQTIAVRLWHQIHIRMQAPNVWVCFTSSV